MRKEHKVDLHRKFILMLALILLFPGCYDTKNADFKPTSLYIGLADDVSGSVNKIGLTELTSQHIVGFITALKKRGGAIAFGLIDDKAFEPLLRLELEAVVGRLDERSRINIGNQRAINDFLGQVDTKVNQQRNARYTDVNGAVARFRLFFEEPVIPANSDKILIFISDGIDTGPWRKLKLRLPPDVQVYAVGMETGLAKNLFGSEVQLFESIDSIIKFITQDS